MRFAPGWCVCGMFDAVMMHVLMRVMARRMSSEMSRPSRVCDSFLPLVAMFDVYGGGGQTPLRASFMCCASCFTA
jgi:hypothetical protein